ncbi:MAG: selenide, water dikinase SelD [Marinifilaceae bacterium]|jgi:selenide,water dikinase|nr:selenide, water dikinase SelD [Marinifilaceae bacterium]
MNRNPITNLNIGYGTKITIKSLEEKLRKSYFSEDDRYHRSAMSDNAAYYDLGNGYGLVNTVSYFPMLMKDFYNYGKFAACSSLNELFATGYKPISASIIAGWPVGKYSMEDSRKIIKGASEICDEAGIKLTGGYNVKSESLFFGLSVNGIVELDKIRSDKNVVLGCDIYTTKPLGIEIALLASTEDQYLDKGSKMYEYITKPNKIGAELATKSYVHGMTNLSCFGLLGHLAEVAKLHDVCNEIYYHNLPKVEHLDEFIDNGFIPQETLRNWNHYKQYTNSLGMKQALVVSDPINCGGLLLAVESKYSQEFTEFCRENDTEIHKIGRVKPIEKENIYVDIK